MGALALADHTASSFPSVPDVISDHLPYVNLYVAGEVVFWLYLTAFAIVFFRSRPRNMAYLLTLLGIYYASRGAFLLLLPIGPPATAPPAADRFVLYPYAGHAYFPGGHVGLLFLLSRFVPSRGARWGFTVAVLLFGIGSVLAKAHYSADVLGGLLLGYGVFVWGERNLARRFRPVR